MQLYHPEMRSCILSKFYIKPQQEPKRTSRRRSCILSKFYIKPQHTSATTSGSSSCILSKFYIKPQRWRLVRWPQGVVSYRNSTSNHNQPITITTASRLYLIEILHQTTTYERNDFWLVELYLIEILHQTTTALTLLWQVVLLYLIEILHQTTTTSIRFLGSICCILSKFYIKPQLVEVNLLLHTVVSYRNSTSNHNGNTRKV